MAVGHFVGFMLSWQRNGFILGRPKKSIEAFCLAWRGDKGILLEQGVYPDNLSNINHSVIV